MPTWRAWVVIAGVAFVATLYGAWRHLPGFPAAARLVVHDAEDQAR